METVTETGSGITEPTLSVVQPSRHLRTAWLVVGSVVAVLSLGMGVTQTVGVLAHEEHTESFSVTDPSIALLDVASDNGRVEVIGGDVTSIRVTARVSDGLTATRFQHRVVGNRYQVRVRCNNLVGGPWCQAALRIVVPRDLEVKVHADDDQVIVRGIDARVEASSNNGSVEAEALGGEAILRSNNGSVRATRLRSPSTEATSNNGSVRLEYEEGPLSAIVRSDNGSVEVALPKGDLAYAVNLQSDNGSTDNRVRTDSTSDRRVVASSNNGSVTVRYLD